MARDFEIQGESLVYVKGNTASAIPIMTQLALSPDAIRVSPVVHHEDCNVDAWGRAPADVQWMLAEARISMTVVHFDPAVLQECVRLSMGGAVGTTLGFGSMARAGTRLGNNAPRFGQNLTTGAYNNYIGLNISAPINNLPWRFFYAYLMDPPFDWPLGTRRSITTLNWRVVPYTQDPANIINGIITGAQNYQLWDRTLDSP
jgi:hypothetical protein